MKRNELLKKWEEKRPAPTPVSFASLNGQQIAVKDESQHSTGTYKDEHGWMIGPDYLINHYPRKRVYYLVSTGNAGIADFAYADMLNEMLGEEMVTVVCFYPKHYDAKILGPDTEGRWTDGKRFREEMEKYRSGKVIQVDFDERFWFDDFEAGTTPCLDRLNELGLKATRENSSDITEGFNPTYPRRMEEFGQQIIQKFGYFPRTLAIVQFGAGMLYDDCKAVARAHNWPIDFLAVSTGNKHTIADKICDTSGRWQESADDLRQIGFTKARNSGDRIYHLEDQEILYGMGIVRELNQTCEPAGGSPLGIIPRLGSIVKGNYELVISFNTGNGIRKCAYGGLVC